jgi:hypothetical protein
MTQSENDNAVGQTHLGIDNTSLFESDGRLTYAAWLLSLECPLVLRAVAKTPHRIQQVQEWLRQWKSAGYPNPGSWPEKGPALPIDRESLMQAAPLVG